MRTVEHRRHSMRPLPGDHLSQEGVELARRVGEDLGPFDLVVTSFKPRAFETAIAMGYAVDRQDELLADVPDGFGQVWDAGFAHLAEVVRQGASGPVATLAIALAGHHRRIVAELPEGGRALIVSHGGFIEAAAIGCCAPDFDFSGWSWGCNYCEGVELAYLDGMFLAPKPLRVN